MRPTDVHPHAAIRTAFQPIVDLRDRSIYAYEALARGPEGEPAAWVFANTRDSDDLGELDHTIRATAMRTARRLAMKARAARVPRSTRRCRTPVGRNFPMTS